jgi:hypothetical protein
MDFWDDVYKKVSDAANYTAKETGKLTETAKLRFNLMREKSRLEEAYKAIGEICYKQFKSGESDEHVLAKAYDKVEASIVEIERINTQINDLKNTKECVSCEYKLDKEMVFCPKCGAKQE